MVPDRSAILPDGPGPLSDPPGWSRTAQRSAKPPRDWPRILASELLAIPPVAGYDS